MEYLNFHVLITGEDYGEYSAKVISSPMGEMISGTPIPDPLQILALRSKIAATPSESSVQALGTLLFETLFTGEVERMLRRAIDSAQFHERTLRIQLTIEPNELSALPWELLYDTGTKQFLALSDHTTLVRYIARHQPPRQKRAIALPLRILALFPNPANMPPIDIDRERQIMEEALQPLVNNALVELIVLEHPTVKKMVEALLTRQVNILYYQGYVGFNPYTKRSYFLLEDREGDAFMKGMMELSYSLRPNDVRLAVINSYGMAAGTLAYDLVRHGVPGAIATQEPLRDAETMTFLQHFSQALAVGLPVDVAVSNGRRAMWLTSGPQGFWASPILVVNQPDAVLFSLKERQ
jgi:hypothetical protein